MAVKQTMISLFAVLTLLVAVATGHLATTVETPIDGQAIACHSSSGGGGGC